MRDYVQHRVNQRRLRQWKSLIDVLPIYPEEMQACSLCKAIGIKSTDQLIDFEFPICENDEGAISFPSIEAKKRAQELYNTLKIADESGIDLYFLGDNNQC